MKKAAKFLVKIVDHMVNFIALLLILMVMFLSCYMLWDSNQVYQAADAKNYEAYIPTEKHTKSFEELQKIAYSARTAHPFQRNGAPFRFKLSKAQQVD